MGWTTPAQVTSGQLFTADLMNELIDNFRVMGTAWVNTTDVAARFDSPGSGSDDGDSTHQAWLMILGAIALVRLQTSIDVGGSFAEGTQRWGWNVQASDVSEWNGFATGVGESILPTAYADASNSLKLYDTGPGVVDGALYVHGTLTGGAFPVTPATGDVYSCGGFVQHALS